MSKTVFIVLIIVVFSFLLGWIFKPDNNIPGSVTMLTDTIWQHDTIIMVERVPDYHTVIDTKWKYYNVDTPAILQAYFDMNISNDTLVNDSQLIVVVNDTISQNRIQNRSYVIARHLPTIIKTETIYATKDEWFIGGYFGQSFGAEVSYLRNKNLFAIGGGTNGLYFKYSRRIK